MNAQSQNDLKRYLSVAGQFQLGGLSTEMPHPFSRNLSDLAKNNPAEGASTLQEIDKLALSRLCKYADRIDELGVAVREALESKSRIFLCGCGATGRLALSLETLGRQELLPERYRESVIGFMAGGDAALIKSIESFEDYEQFGEEQLRELGFSSKDLLIAITEGGETPFVIGACEYAAKIADRPPWFVYCNEDDILCSLAARSARVIDNSRITKLNLTVGAMAIAGSTRMQASTVQMAAVGHALFFDLPAIDWLRDLFRIVSEADYRALAPFVVEEVNCYERHEYLVYKTRHFGITVLTDTTERAPTFSLAPFENTENVMDEPCLSSLCVTGAPSAKKAWEHLLQREPRCLEWSKCQESTGLENFMGFDLSEMGIVLREKRIGQGELKTFSIASFNNALFFNFGKLQESWGYGDADLLKQHLLLKMLLNAHSTLAMGRMGRYEGNVMTWVKPSNNKLIDRAIRYVQELWYREKDGGDIAYHKVAEMLFEEREWMLATDPIVMKTFERLKKNSVPSARLKRLK